MFPDGVKISVPSETGKKWLNNSALEFESVVNRTTGEIKNGRIAKYKGLIFLIKERKKYEGEYYCELRGSLHVYFNNGEHNADTFTYQNLVWVLYDLQLRFGIDLQKAAIHNLEFGLNINTDIDPNIILKSLISWGRQEFFGLQMEQKRVGKKIEQQRVTLKVYNKAVLNCSLANTLRVELAAKKMDYFRNKANITHLSDLIKIPNLLALGSMLLKEWNEILYYDFGINEAKMEKQQFKRFQEYIRPAYWIGLEKTKRKRSKAELRKILDVFGTSTTQKDVSSEITKAMIELQQLECTRLNQHRNCYICDNFYRTANKEIRYYFSSKMYTFEQLECNSHKCTSNNHFNDQNKSVKTLKMSSKLCACCGGDISNKKSSAIFCSKKCNNTINGLKRTERRKMVREKKLATALVVHPLNDLNNTSQSVGLNDNSFTKRTSKPIFSSELS